MPGKGSPKIILRVPTELLDRIREAITSNNAFRGGQPYDLSGWIRQAITERLDKLARSRKGRKAKSKEAGDQVEDLETPPEGVIHPKESGPVGGTCHSDQASDLWT